jgi:hypothetical protein
MVQIICRLFIGMWFTPAAGKSGGGSAEPQKFSLVANFTLPAAVSARLILPKTGTAG